MSDEDYDYYDDDDDYDEDDYYDDERECDKCGRITDAGEYPDWINGVCEYCDPSILNHPDNKML